MNRIDNIKELRENSIFVFDDFIDQEKINDIIFTIDDSLWTNSMVVSKENNICVEHYSQIRTSKTIFEYLFSEQLRKLVRELQHEIALKTDLEADKLEGWQITKYGFEEKFEFHLDCGLLEKDPAGEREKTILLYLMSPDKGGETYFRALNLYIRPVQGRLVVWNNLLPDGHCNYAMMHAGLPVKKGVKIILNTWIRQFSKLKTHQYETTGKSDQRHHQKVWRNDKS